MAIEQLPRTNSDDRGPVLDRSVMAKATVSSVEVSGTPTTRTLLGLIAIALGAWGGLVPFIGHALNFNADGSSLWTWNLSHALLYLAPGITAVVGGAAIMLSAWVSEIQGLDISRLLLPLGSLVIALSGTWFVLGPSIWPIYFTSRVFAAAAPVRSFAEMVAYNLGVGVLLCMLAGVAGTWTVQSIFRRRHGLI
jgi:hypothetical protein